MKMRAFQKYAAAAVMAMAALLPADCSALARTVAQVHAPSPRLAKLVTVRHSHRARPLLRDDADVPALLVIAMSAIGILAALDRRRFEDVDMREAHA